MGIDVATTEWTQLRVQKGEGDGFATGGVPCFWLLRANTTVWERRRLYSVASQNQGGNSTLECELHTLFRMRVKYVVQAVARSHLFQKVLSRLPQTHYITVYMGKKKKKKKRQTPKVVQPSTEQPKISPVDSVELRMEEPVPDNPIDTSSQPEAVQETKVEDYAAPETPEKKEPGLILSAVEEKLNRNIQAKSRIRRMLPDIIRVALALTVIGVGAAIWWKPPLMSASFPVATFKYRNSNIKEAELYRPIAMQERYYLKLPEQVADKYEWFAIDRRREVVALTEEPKHTFFGQRAIKRSDPLGIDLEFRKIDGYEWLIYFYSDAIVFSNNLLTVRLDTKTMEK